MGSTAVFGRDCELAAQPDRVLRRNHQNGQRQLSASLPKKGQPRPGAVADERQLLGSPPIQELDTIPRTAAPKQQPSTEPSATDSEMNIQLHNATAADAAWSYEVTEAAVRSYVVDTWGAWNPKSSTAFRPRPTSLSRTASSSSTESVRGW